MKTAAVIGAGLAGVEAANQLAKRGIKVSLYEMKPKKFSPAHKSEGFAELVCSNSLKAARLNSSAGLLKHEMRQLGSLVMESADRCAVPAGGALAVDRDLFSGYVTEKIKQNPFIEVINEEVTSLPEADAVIIAAGPLASEGLIDAIKPLTGEGLSFFDAAAPIITRESVDMTCAFLASRYERGGDDYINCPMNKEEYEHFYEEIMKAERAPVHSFDERKDVYEGCMPIEALASRGKDTMRYGPLKPVGLIDPRTGHRPWANLQLRKENAEGSLLNLVGFQTNLKFGEQKRVFSLFPALKNAEFVRYGVMHRNTFIDSPRLLNSDFLLQGTLDALEHKYRAEFFKLFQAAKNPAANQNTTFIQPFTTRKRLNPMSEKRYIYLTDQVFNILQDNKTPIPSDRDLFILNLVTSEKFRIGICKKFPPKDFKRIKELCQDLLDNEMKDDSKC